MVETNAYLDAPMDGQVFGLLVEITLSHRPDDDVASHLSRSLRGPMPLL